jgi:hypothetical protein
MNTSALLEQLLRAGQASMAQQGGSAAPQGGAGGLGGLGGLLGGLLRGGGSATASGGGGLGDLLGGLGGMLGGTQAKAAIAVAQPTSTLAMPPPSQPRRSSTAPTLDLCS